MSCPAHRVVSLTGSVGPDGSAAYYNVIFSMAEVIGARHFPMPLPVYVASPEERATLHAQGLIRSTLELAATADVAFVGIGEMDAEAPLYLDGFLSAAELHAAQASGAVGEICGWIFDQDGRLIDGRAERAHRQRADPGQGRGHGDRARQGPAQAAGNRRGTPWWAGERARHRRGHRGVAARAPRRPGTPGTNSLK